MDFNKLSSFYALQQSIMYHSAKQDVIAQNIAHASTPGYHRMDMKAPDFGSEVKKKLREVKLETTNPNHIAQTTSSFDALKFSTKDTVELDMEALDMMKNSNEFAKATQTYKKMLGLVRDAIGDKSS